jgi:hypothetical protein
MSSDVFPNSRVTLAIYEKHTFKHPRVGSAVYEVSAFEGKPEATIREFFFDFSFPQP